MDYETIVYEELRVWRNKVLKKSSLFNQLSKKAQKKINSMIPEKAHQIITDSIKNMVKATLAGSNMTTKKPEPTELSLF